MYPKNTPHKFLSTTSVFSKCIWEEVEATVPKYSTFSDIVGAVPGFRFGRLFPRKKQQQKNSTLTMFFHVNGKKNSACSTNVHE